MTRLPPALRPLWPAAKLVHRTTARNFGRLNRHISRDGDARALPKTATTLSSATVSADPDRCRLHVSGAATHLQRQMPSGDPSGHWYFEDLLEHVVPQRFTLELTGGSLVGNYAAHITASGVLDYETSDYFGIFSWEEHPLFLRRRLPPLTEVQGSVVSVATRGTSNNYYHALMDLAARWGVFEETHPGVTPDAVVVNSTHRYHRELLTRLGLDKLRRIEATKHVAVRADTLLVPCLPNPNTLAPPWVTSFLQQRLPPMRTTGLPTKLYVTRGQRPNTRRVVDDAGLRGALEREGFVTLDPGTVSLQEQIDHFAAARVIVAPHGAGLTNINFCRPGVRVLELFAPTYLNPGFWAITSNIADSHYRYLVADRPRTRAAPHPMSGIQHDIRLAPRDVLEALQLLLED